jgi:hypothetical protein
MSDISRVVTCIDFIFLAWGGMTHDASCLRAFG